jgi:DNA-directed RNA polymerase specialized sigma24 family protein
MPDRAADPAFFCAKNSDGVNAPEGNTPLQAVEAAASAAPFLFSEEEIGAEKLEATGEFSGERLLARRPETYRAVVRMLAEGLSMSSIARALGVSRNTVAAVRERDGFSIEQDKKELLRDFRRAARLSVERAIELVPHIQTAKDAAIVAAVMTDKLQLLSGEATSRVEKVEVNQDKLAEMLASLPVLEAELVPLTGPSAAAPEQKGFAALPGVMPAGVVSDSLSEVLTSFADRSSAMSATLVATSPAAAGVEPGEGEAGLVDQVGGEGVADFAPPPSQPTGLGSQKIFDKGVSDAPQDASDSSTLP